MKKMHPFLKNTFHMIKEDEILIMLLLAPVLMAVVMKYGSIALCNWLINDYGFDLHPYFAYIDGFVFLMGGMIYGMLIAFMIIDELDEGVIQYYKITPFGGKGYLKARFLLPLFALLILFLMISLFFTLNQYAFTQIMVMWLFGITQMYFSGMLVVALANNKLEALVVSKMLGLVLLPFIFTVIDSPYVYLFAFFPTLFLGLGVGSMNTFMYYGYIFIAIGITVVMIIFLRQRFFSKIYLKSE